MKIKRLTFTKLSIRLGCILIPLIIMYHWVPKEIRVDFPFVYMAFTLIIYEFGRFIRKEIINETYY